MTSETVIRDCPPPERPALALLIDECFHGIYRWHAARTLEKVSLVRVADVDGSAAGITMLSELDSHTAYLYYIAVRPAYRGKGLGRQLLEDAFAVMRAWGAGEMLSAARRDNAASIGLLTACGFEPAGFRSLARARGLREAVGLWRRMVVAPGEAVFRRAF
jgi:ribosomal protein S18 acetylase RimI-like enzyme